MRRPPFQLAALLSLALCGCTERSGNDPSAATRPTAVSPADSNARIEVNPELHVRLIPYAPAAAEDATNGRLGELLARHRAACASNNPSAFYVLFNQATRFLYAKASQERLLRNFKAACDEKFIGELERSFARGELQLAPDGHTEQGYIRLSLCPIERMQGGKCRNGIEISAEDGELRWGFH